MMKKMIAGALIVIATLSSLVFLSVRAQEGVRHELPIVTHWSNERKAFEYMASDQPDYRVPPVPPIAGFSEY